MLCMEECIYTMVSSTGGNGCRLGLTHFLRMWRAWARQAIATWRAIPQSVLFLALLSSVRREARNQQQRHRRERARARRIATFIEQQAHWTRAFLLILVGTCSLAFRTKRSVWMLPRTSQFWESDVLKMFTSRQWIEIFQMTKDSFVYHICLGINISCTLVRTTFPHIPVPLSQVFSFGFTLLRATFVSNLS